MSRREKLLARIRNNPTQVRFEEIDKVLKNVGFEKRHTGSHYVYSHLQVTGVVTVVRPHGKAGSQFVKPIYIKKALELIDSLEG